MELNNTYYCIGSPNGEVMYTSPLKDLNTLTTNYSNLLKESNNLVLYSLHSKEVKNSYIYNKNVSDFIVKATVPYTKSTLCFDKLVVEDVTSDIIFSLNSNKFKESVVRNDKEYIIVCPFNRLNKIINDLWCDCFENLELKEFYLELTISSYNEQLLITENEPSYFFSKENKNIIKLKDIELIRLANSKSLVSSELDLTALFLADLKTLTKYFHYVKTLSKVPTYLTYSLDQGFELIPGDAEDSLSKIRALNPYYFIFLNEIDKFIKFINQFDFKYKNDLIKLFIDYAVREEFDESRTLSIFDNLSNIYLVLGNNEVLGSFKPIIKSFLNNFYGFIEVTKDDLINVPFINKSNNPLKPEHNFSYIDNISNLLNSNIIYKINVNYNYNHVPIYTYGFKTINPITNSSQIFHRNLSLDEILKGYVYVNTGELTTFIIREKSSDKIILFTCYGSKEELVHFISEDYIVEELDKSSKLYKYYKLKCLYENIDLRVDTTNPTELDNLLTKDFKLKVRGHIYKQVNTCNLYITKEDIFEFNCVYDSLMYSFILPDNEFLDISSYLRELSFLPEATSESNYILVSAIDNKFIVKELNSYCYNYHFGLNLYSVNVRNLDLDKDGVQDMLDFLRGDSLYSDKLILLEKICNIHDSL